ncbi:MAG TPA: hypothetical protein DCZ92_01615 [Elusimicrobia bacterium]|nr:MAG: hypothetical protein A2016_12300 [Elusimicrobia bacterium GWF2_62_30]HBA59524.1 hypothetical protein [Elusimicrobiota bacterium]
MKTNLNLLFAVVLCAALSLPAFAQEEDPAAMMPEEGQTQEGAQSAADEAPAPKPKAKKAAAKKKKKKKPAPVSEYKFMAESNTPTYKFDKKADPIVKKSKKKKTAAKTEYDADGKPIPKLKKVKSFSEQDQPEGPAGANPLAGMNIPGMGGK